MEHDRLSRAWRVTNRHAAALFTQPAMLDVICRIAIADMTASQVAQTLKVDIGTICYRLGRLCQLGVAKVVDHKVRAGRPMRIYRASAMCFFVPGEFAASNFGAQMNRALRDAIDRAGPPTGELFYVEGDRFHARKIADEVEHSCNGAEWWMIAHLDETTARVLAGEMKALLARYNGTNPSASRKRYLIHAAFAPAAAT